MLIEDLKKVWWKRVIENGIKDKEITVKVESLTSQEAIGSPLKREYPLLKGKESLIQASIGDSFGQAFVDEPASFSGALEDVKNLPLNSNKNRGIFIATVNATYKYLGLVDNTIHCKNDGPEVCARKIAEQLSKDFPRAKIGIIGFQPAIVTHLSKLFKIRVGDMDIENIGKTKEGVLIESWELDRDIIEWSDIVLATGSSIVNNSIDSIIEASKGKKLFFFGVTISALAYEFGFNRLCFEAT